VRTAVGAANGAHGPQIEALLAKAYCAPKDAVSAAALLVP